MLTDPSIEKLKEKGQSPYDVAVLVSKRARQLVDGAQPMVDDTDAANVVSLACREVAADKVVAVRGDEQPVVPITREEKIRRIEEEEAKRKAREEELAEQAAVYEQREEESADQPINIDLLANAVFAAADDDDADADEDEGYDEDAEPTDEELAAEEESDS